MVGYGGEQSLDRYLAISARGVPFNVAHAVGNVALALAAGPALVRMISRYRSRFEFEWPARPPAPTRGDRGDDPPIGRRTAAIALAVAMLVAMPASGAEPTALDPPCSGSSAPRAPTAASPLRPARARAPRSPAGLRSGSRRRASTRSTFEAAGPIADRLPALRPGRHPLDRRPRADHPRPGRRRGEPAAVRRSRPRGRAANPALGERLIRGPGQPDRVRSPRSARGRSPSVRASSFRLLAPRCPERRRRLGLPTRSRQRPRQHRGGAPGPGGGGGPGPSDAPGRVLSATRAAGRRRLRARRYRLLERPVDRLGDPGAAGRRGKNPAAVRTGGESTLGYLAARQAGDGHYRYSASSDQTPVWVTAQALVAAERKAFPLAAVRRARGGRSRSGAGSHSGHGSAAAGGVGRAAGSEEHRGARRPARPGDTSTAGPRAAPHSGRGRSAQVTARPVGAALLSREDTSDGGKSGGEEITYVAAGFGLLIAALAAGFLWYRRRLP